MFAFSKKSAYNINPDVEKELGITYEDFLKLNTENRWIFIQEYLRRKKLNDEYLSDNSLEIKEVINQNEKSKNKVLSLFKKS